MITCHKQWSNFSDKPFGCLITLTLTVLRANLISMYFCDSYFLLKLRDYWTQPSQQQMVIAKPTLAHEMLSTVGWHLWLHVWGTVSFLFSCCFSLTKNLINVFTQNIYEAAFSPICLIFSLQKDKKLEHQVHCPGHWEEWEIETWQCHHHFTQ